MMTPERVLDDGFLEARSQLLEVAATLDRYDRAGGEGDPRLDRLYAALRTLAERPAGPDRCERLLNLFSDPA